MLTVECSGMVEAAFSTSQGSQKSIEELLELVREFKAQQHQSNLWSFNSEASTLRSASDQSQVPPPVLPDEQVSGNVRASGGFDIEIHSGPEALLAGFRNSSS